MVLVGGINSEFFKENFSQIWTGFGVTPKPTPKEDVNFVGLYMESTFASINSIESVGLFKLSLA